MISRCGVTSRKPSLLFHEFSNVFTAESHLPAGRQGEREVHLEFCVYAVSNTFVSDILFQTIRMVNSGQASAQYPQSTHFPSSTWA
jgi:hypothetical protein